MTNPHERTAMTTSIPPRGRQVKSPLIVPDVAGLSCAEAAHAYLDAGFWPIPWKSVKGNKMPAYPKGWTYDTVERESHTSIGRWDKLWRVGLITSPRSGLLVCDIDHPAEWERWDVPEPEDFVMSRTGRDGGQHHLYDARGLSAELWPRQGDIPGGQVKSNGFIGVQPSRHPKGRPYCWVGDNRRLPHAGKFARVLAEYRERHPSANGPSPAASGGRPETDVLWDELLDAGDGAQRGAMFAWALDAHDRGMTDSEIVSVLWLAVRDGDIPSYSRSNPWTRDGVRGAAIPTGGWEHVPGGRLSEGLTGDAAQDKENAAALRRERARLYAKDVVAGELAGDISGPSLAGKGRLLSEDLAMPRPPVRWAVESLATIGSQVTLPSSRKTGKTTFLLNLCRAAGNGTQFLDRFDCSMDGVVGYINAEMLFDDFTGYCRHLGGGVWLERMCTLHCRDDGLRINLLNDEWCSVLVEWCVSHDVEWLIADPWKNFLGWASAGMNDNDAVLALSDRFRAIAVEAHLSLVVIPMHTTQERAEDGYERGKGAGELEDGADWLWRYTRVGAGGDSPRMLSSEGRGPGVSEMAVEWDSSTYRLSADLVSRTRAEVTSSSHIDEVVSALEVLSLRYSRVNKTRLKGELHGCGNNQGMNRAISAAVRAGAVVETAEGDGKSTWYSLP